jgi:hypothetical protein
MTFGAGPFSKGAFDGSIDQFPQLDYRSIVSFIDQHSVGIRYWKAVECPCLNPKTGQPDITCNSCRGLGWYHLAHELDLQYQRAMVHSRNSSERQVAGGRITVGGASITFLPGVIPGDGDLVQVCKDKEVVNNEVHIVGEQLTDGSSGESFRFRDILCVEKVIVWNATTGTVSELASDAYAFDASTRRIEFLHPVSVGLKYSVRYVARPEFILRADTAKPLLRVHHDDRLFDPQRIRKDVVYPFQCMAVRLDRAITQRQRGNIDYTVQSTYNSPAGKGPFL